MNWRRIVWLLALVTLPTLAEETPLQLVLRGAQHDQLYQLSSSGVTKVSALPDTLTTPLGSLWKLYVYAWLEDTHQPEQPYQCRGNSPEEVYCCQAGESITRDTALVRSCGLYFAPQRLHIGADVWGQYWQQRQAPAWLASLTTLKPETSVTVKSLLDSLATLPAQNKAQEVLLDVVLDEAKIGVASMLGSRVRVKTWSWFADDKQEIRQGGFAGWLTDGSPLWVTGSGTSKTVLTRYATVLNRVLPVPTQVASGQCVEVELFARYPLKKITAEKSTTAVKPGVLNGRYRVTFANGNHITFVSHGETTLLSEKGKLKLQSHLDREEYVARVLDREAKSTPPEAAKAMTVAIRTFLQQNANREGDCLTIPTVAPRSVFLLRQRPRGANDDRGRRILSMRAIRFIIMAVALPKGRFRRQATASGAGERYDQILAFAYPDNSLSRWGAPRSSCQLLPKAKAWLAKKMPQWRRILQGETGYNEPDVFAVCRLVSGFPYTDRQQKRLFIRNFFTLQDRLDLTHEYLHLAFDGYPTGLDENYIETLTRQLLMD
ncbi:hypothetical protein ECZU26_52520 [Escherichia coli]|nr:hypothetical protein ECZU26_52520 [Escherichia coli]